MAVDLSQLHPTLRRKVLAVLSDLKGHGFPAKIASGWRSLAEQKVLYDHGRSKVLFSFHNATRGDGTPCSLAADIVDERLGWNAVYRFWELLGRSAAAHELYKAAAWDRAHVQLLPNSELQRVKDGYMPPEM